MLFCVSFLSCTCFPGCAFPSLLCVLTLSCVCAHLSPQKPPFLSSLFPSSFVSLSNIFIVPPLSFFTVPCLLFSLPFCLPHASLSRALFMLLPYFNNAMYYSLLREKYMVIFHVAESWKCVTRFYKLILFV